MQLKPALPTGSGSSERRSGERRRVRLLARARGGDRTYTLEIMDISQRGMLLRGAVPLDQGDKVEIELSDRAEDNIIATVAWAAGANLGCYLERALTPAELAHAALRARPRAPLSDAERAPARRLTVQLPQRERENKSKGTIKYYRKSWLPVEPRVPSYGVGHVEPDSDH